MRRTRASACPGVAGAGQHATLDQAFFRNNALKGGEPMAVISLAGIGIAGRLRLLDLIAERCRPFAPGEDTALVERNRQCKGFRLPRRPKNWAITISWDAKLVIPAERAERFRVSAHAVSKYGSNASIETFSEGSALSPHNSRPSNSTV